MDARAGIDTAALRCGTSVAASGNGFRTLFCLEVLIS
jgi:hypothetical protein